MLDQLRHATEAGAIWKLDADHAVAKLGDESRAVSLSRAGFIASQMLGLAFTRCVLELPPVVALERADIVRRVGATVQAYLYDA